MEQEQQQSNSAVDEISSGSQSKQTKQPAQASYAVPGAIVIAGALIALSIIYSDRSGAGKGNLAANVGGKDVAPADVGEMRAVSAADHIRGNADAPVIVVEYSDLECPFCKRFHQTMQEVMNEYQAGGQVAWVYRHFPLEQLHPKAFHEAEATECAAKLGGNDAFWAYTDKIFEITPANNRLDESLLTTVAVDLGINKTDFEKCLASGEFKEKVKADIQDAANVGAQGTPYSIVVTKSGKKFVISGAYPYENVKQTIEAALAEK